MSNPFQRGKSWTFYYYVQDDYGKRKQIWKGGYATKKEAETELKKCKAMVELNQITYQSRNAIKVEQYLNEWLTDRKPTLQPHTAESYGYTIKKHINPAVGNIKLQDLTSRVIQRFYSNLAVHSGLSGKTIQFIHSILKVALKQAINDGLVKQNIFTGVKIPRTNKFKHQLLSIEQIRKLLSALEGSPYEVEIKLAILLGLRRGEVLGITEHDIDFDRHTIAIQQQVSIIKGSNGDKRYFGLKCLKSVSSNRVLYISDEIENLLRTRIDQNRQRKEMFGDKYKDLGLVCCKKNGDIFNPCQLTKHFQKILEECGLPKIRFHDLRHSYATLCIDMNIPLKVLSQSLGHSSTAITDMVYADSIKANRNLAKIITDAILADEDKPEDTPESC